MSSGGGFCDCGDLEAWKHDPFCEDHGCIVDKVSVDSSFQILSDLMRGLTYLSF